MIVRLGFHTVVHVDGPQTPEANVPAPRGKVSPFCSRKKRTVPRNDPSPMLSTLLSPISLMSGHWVKVAPVVAWSTVGNQPSIGSLTVISLISVQPRDCQGP